MKLKISMRMSDLWSDGRYHICPISLMAYCSFKVDSPSSNPLTIPWNSAVILRLVGWCPNSHTYFKDDYRQALAILDGLLDHQRAPYIGWKAEGFTFNDFGDFYGNVRNVVFVHNLFKVKKKIPMVYVDADWFILSAMFSYFQEEGSRTRK